MIIKLIIFSFLAVTFYSFYHRKLNQKLKPSFVKPVTMALTLVSLAPMGWIFGLIGLYVIPKLFVKKPAGISGICAKCGTLAKGNESKCSKCSNILN
jgi:hypothetical protein